MIYISNKILNFCLLYIVLSMPAQAQITENSTQPFKEIDELLSLGTPGLALRILEEKQPALSVDNQQHWLEWEKKRIQLMQQLRHWSPLVERIIKNRQNIKDKKLEEISQQDINWFTTQQVKAYLSLKNDSDALPLLSKMLWHTDEFVESDDIATWRRLVIRSYLQMNKVEDAQRAMRRYLQDYGNLGNNDGLQWTILQMQLLMRTQRYQEVIRSLSDAKTDEEKAMLLIAELENKSKSPQQVKEIISQLVSKKDQSENIFNFVLLKTAITEKDLALKIQIIERFIASPKSNKINEVFYDAHQYISADSLWDAYEALGYESANKYKLLRGDDDAWYLQASNLFVEQPVQSRAMYTVLAFNAKKQQHRTLAFEQLVKLLGEHESGIEIINALFMQSERITDIEKVPVNVRYRLVDYALSHADLKSAAKLMQKLQQPPEGEDVFAWGLRRARILIMGRQYQQGVEVLNQLLVDRKEISDIEIDQYMQVLFDLQSIDQHALALQGFEKLDQFPLNKKLKREVSFWRAESHQAQGQYELAAYLFLKSAQPIDDTFDPWFHTASFKAAESLTQAKLLGDARKQYIKLLRITKNKARKSVIKQRLQRLRLLKSKTL